MPQFTMEMPPSVNTSADLIALRKYIARLVDRLMYTLNNIDDENLLGNGISLSKLRGGEAGIANAAIANMGTASIGTASISHVNAQVAEIITAVIKTAVIDWAKLKHVSGDTAIISRFVGEKMFIDQLAVTSAQMVELWAGTLCIKAADGNFYRLNVDLENGTVTADAVTVTQAEYDAGQLSSGQHIIESSITAEELDATSISAVEALISKIIATRIDVDELFAREATIETLTTGSIASALGQSLNLSSNESILSTVRRIAAEGDGQIQTQLGQVKLTADAARTSVQDLQNRLGTHFIVESDKIRITQDQTQNWEMQLTAGAMGFLNRSTQQIAASFGVSGGYADRLQSYKKLSVGNDDSGWYDMTERGGAVDDKWRGLSSDAAAVITAQPADVIADAGDSTFGLGLTAENAAEYQWEYRERGSGDDWTPISGETGASLTGVELDTEALAREYRCTVHGVPSEAVRVYVDGAPVIVGERESAGTMTVTAAGTVSGYTWQQLQGGSWTDISGAASGSYTAGGAGRYRCVAEDANGRKAVSGVFVIV